MRGYLSFFQVGLALLLLLQLPALAISWDPSAARWAYIYSRVTPIPHQTPHQTPFTCKYSLDANSLVRNPDRSVDVTMREEWSKPGSTGRTGKYYYLRYHDHQHFTVLAAPMFDASGLPDTIRPGWDDVAHKFEVDRVPAHDHWSARTIDWLTNHGWPLSES